MLVPLWMKSAQFLTGTVLGDNANSGVGNLQMVLNYDSHQPQHAWSGMMGTVVQENLESQGFPMPDLNGLSSNVYSLILIENDRFLDVNILVMYIGGETSL